MVLETELRGVEQELVVKLREMLDDDVFVLTVRACLKTDREREAVLQAILDGDVIDDSDVTLFALDIHNDRQEHSPKEDVA